jgi:hypothetical protein
MVRRGGMLALAAVLASACGSEPDGGKPDEQGAQTAVVCVEESADGALRCTCKEPTNGCDEETGRCHFGSDDFGPDDGNVLSCEGFACCVLTESACSCAGEAATCELRAEQLGGQVVPGCATPLLPDACATEGERCQPRYDAAQSNACCSGLVCAASDDGITSCRIPEVKETERGLLCERVARHDSYPIVSVEPVATSLGTIPLAAAGDAYGTLFAPAGCLGHLELSLGHDDCELRFEADRAADGKLTLSYLSLDTSGCESDELGDTRMIFDTDEGAQIPATLEADMLTCEASVSANRYCAAGELTLRFLGPVVEGEGAIADHRQMVSFDRPLKIELALCGQGSAALSCP